MCDLLDSIETEFLPETRIIFADLGSTDSTMDVIKAHVLHKRDTVRLLAFDIGTSTLTALSSELPNIETEYVLGISGDDVFSDGFGQVIRGISHDRNSQRFMINVTLVHTDECLNPLKVQNPHWSDSRRLNRYKLSFGNPGTGPGAIYPVSELVHALEKKNLHGLLIEDYFIYWQLVDKVNFVNLPTAKIHYRRHPNALGKQYRNPQFAKSIGFSVGLSFSNSSNLLQSLLSVFLFLRWIRHIPLKNIGVFLSGCKVGYNF